MSRNTSLAEILEPDRNSFGVIRLAMAIAVLVSHSYFFVSGVSSSEPLVMLTGHSLGEHGVQVFFLLSGILVTESLLRSRSIASFSCGRLLRVFPGLIVCVGLVTFVLGPVVSRLTFTQYLSDPQWFSYAVKTLLLVTGAAELPGVFKDLPAAGLVDMSLWTLKYEIICYLGLATLGAFGVFRERFRGFTAAALAAVLCILWLKAPIPDGSNSLTEHVRYFALYFGVGTLAVLLKDRLPVRRWATLPLFALFLLSIGTAMQELICALFLGYATIVTATYRFGPLRDWCNRNDLSFGVYIYAAPIQQALLQLQPGLGPISLAILALVISAGFASLSWKLVEKPAMRLRARATDAVERCGHVPARIAAALGFKQPNTA